MRCFHHIRMENLLIWLAPMHHGKALHFIHFLASRTPRFEFSQVHYEKCLINHTAGKQHVSHHRI